MSPTMNCDDSDPDDPTPPKSSERGDPCKGPSLSKKRKVTDYFSSPVPIVDDQSESENDTHNKECTKPSDAMSASSEGVKDSSSISLDKLSPEDQKAVTDPQSLVWKFFTRLEGEQKAKCNTCDDSFNIPQGTTTVLKNHLKKHGPVFKDYSKLQEIKNQLSAQSQKNSKPSGSGKKQVPPSQCVRGMFGYDPKSKKSKEITKAIGVFLCKGCHPYQLVEEPAFIALLKLLDPKYSVPTRTTFSRTVIPKLYSEVRDKVLKEIDSARDILESVSLTTDIWTARNGDSFIAVTMQYMLPSFTMKHFTLDCQPFPGAHDALAIHGKVSAALEKLHLDNKEISKYINSDNAANMKKGLSTLSEEEENEESKLMWIHINCFNHTLQLAITDTKKEFSANTVIDSVSAQVGRYNRSKPAREGLNLFQKQLNLPEHSLLQTVSTRWDADFYMLERFNEQKLAITSEQARAGVESLTPKEWALVSGFVEVLRPIVLFTAEMGSTQKPTLSMVLPALFEFKTSLKDFIKTAKKGTGIMFARSLCANIESRFPDDAYLRSELYQTAMLVNPKFKDVLMTNNLTAVSLLQGKALEKFRQHVRRGLKATPATNKDHSEKKKPDEPAKSQQKTVKWSHFKKKALQVKAAEYPDEVDSIRKEVETYLNEPTINGDEDSLQWWNINKERFPYLAPVAQHFLGLAATETPSERVFSVGGNVTNKRTDLLPEHVEQIVFCHDNASLL